MKTQGITFSCRAKLSGKLFNQLAVLHISFNIHDINKFIRIKQTYPLNASLSFPDGLRIYYGFKGELIIKDHCSGKEKVIQFQFQAVVEGKSYVLKGSTKFNGRFLSGAGKQAKINLYAGTNPLGRALQTAEFKIAVADWVYLRRSMPVYKTDTCYKGRLIKKTLKSYFFSDN